MLLTYYGSPVCANYSVISAGAIRFISNWKKHKCHRMSKHLKDRKYTSVPRG